MLPERIPYTLTDLQQIEDDNRYELIDGEIYQLAAPVTDHVYAGSRLIKFLNRFFDSSPGPCQPFFSPADVYLFNQPGDSSDEIETVVQPDIFVICDLRQMGEKGFFGPPKLVIEILSPSSARMDRMTKFQKYQAAGVQEYWIVNPRNRTITVHVLENGIYTSGEVYTDGETLHSEIFPGLDIHVGEIFPPLS